MALPNEVLQLIFHNFCSHCRQEPISVLEQQSDASPQDGEHADAVHHRTLLSLCLVSRQFRDVAQPLLYHQFALGYKPGYPPVRDAHRQQMLSFMQTVMRRRDLARKVNRVFIHANLIHSLQDAEELLVTLRRAAAVSSPFLFPSPDKIAYEETRLRDYAKFKEAFTPEFYEGSQWGALTYRYEKYLAMEVMAALVALLPRLTHLITQDCSIQSQVKTPYPYALQIFDIRVPSIKTFETSLPINHVAGIIDAAMNLETLYLDLTNDHPLPWFHREAMVEFPAMPKLKHIRFTRSRIEWPMMRMILSKCTSHLETFHYEPLNPKPPRHCIRRPPDDNAAPRMLPIPPDQIIQMLSVHKSSLKHLHLNYRGIRYEEMFPVQLREFTALTDIFYGTFAVFPLLEPLRRNNLENWVLSASLRSLELASISPYRLVSYGPASIMANMAAGETEGLAEKSALFSLAGAKTRWPYHFANLEKVEFSYDTRPLDDEELDELTSVFASSGVRFTHKHVKAKANMRSRVYPILQRD